MVDYDREKVLAVFKAEIANGAKRDAALATAARAVVALTQCAPAPPRVAEAAFEIVRKDALARHAAEQRTSRAPPASQECEGDAAATLILEAYRTTVPVAEAESGAETASPNEDEAAVTAIMTAFRSTSKI